MYDSLVVRTDFHIETLLNVRHMIETDAQRGTFVHETRSQIVEVEIKYTDVGIVASVSRYDPSHSTSARDITLDQTDAADIAITIVEFLQLPAYIEL